LRTLIAKIRASPQRLDKFSAQCAAFKIKDKKLILDVKTRWNSTYDMIVRARELQEVTLFAIKPLFIIYITDNLSLFKI